MLQLIGILDASALGEFVDTKFDDHDGFRIYHARNN